ncbi:hypothetical protein [Mesoplasma tabanidae]|uniref:sn-glycerol-3-phosphate ABC transporter substrate-binding protein n=1 Tax=Mesoplasma tabanidae TaxID=219745 RepID=A0A2K8P512_9MOLU|nr:hypothetical protein [Mesoplasma tabanidae]ATZ21230.1 sn-glycerol-3-phosphate ABC transporter substrate-binding protein [Mesoplasma tabanidae]
MKKLLLTLSSVTLVSTAGMSVVSCGVKPEKSVIFMLPGEAVGTASIDKKDAYMDMAEEFNAIHKDETGFVPVEVRWAKSGTINDAILTGDNLPDLYVSYADAVSLYANTKVGDQVRDMESSIGEAGYSKLTGDIVDDSFLKEGQYKMDGSEKATQIVLPFGKSVELSVINVNFFLEFVSKIKTGALTEGNGSDEISAFDGSIVATKARTAFEEFNNSERKNLTGEGKLSGTKVYKDDLVINEANLGNNQNAKESLARLVNLFNELGTANAQNIDEKIREIFSKNETIIDMATVYNAVKSNFDLRYADKKGDLHNVNKSADSHFSFGIDSLANKYFMDQAARSGIASIDITNKDNGFFYNATYDKATRVANVEFDQTSDSFQDTSKFLQDFKDIALSNDNASQQLTYKEQWNGTLNLSRQEGTTKYYTSDSFLVGSSFMSSGSTAGAYNFVKDRSVSKDETYQPVTNADVLTASTSTAQGKKSVFMSQGPGIAGFKSTGSNAADKEKTVTAFLNYMMQPKQAADFALKSNYMPPTKSGMLIYQNYVNGDFNNTKGKVGDASNQILSGVVKKLNEKNETNNGTAFTVENTFTPVRSTSKNRLSSQAAPNAVNSGFIENYLNLGTNVQPSKTILVTSTPAPIGSTVRDGIATAMTGTGTITDLNKAKEVKFTDLLNKANYVYNLNTYVMKKNNTDMFSKINMTFKKTQNK